MPTRAEKAAAAGKYTTEVLDERGVPKSVDVLDLAAERGYVALDLGDGSTLVARKRSGRVELEAIAELPAGHELRRPDPPGVHTT